MAWLAAALPRWEVTMGIGLIVVSAFVFYRIAVIEQLNPWTWAGASVLVSLVAGTIAGLFTMLVAQAGLFAVLWFYNVRHKASRASQWADEHATARKVDDERRRWAEAEIQRDRERRHQEGAKAGGLGAR